MGLEERKQVRDIEGVMYEVTPLPFGIGRKALKKFFDAYCHVVGGAGKGADAMSQAAGMFEAIPEAMSDEDLSYFANIFGNASKYQDGDRWVPLVSQNQELHFAGRYLEFVRWLMFCMEVNFQGFFLGLRNGALKGDLDRLMPKVST